jgi:hypothetical protein
LNGWAGGRAAHIFPLEGVHRLICVARVSCSFSRARLLHAFGNMCVKSGGKFQRCMKFEQAPFFSGAQGFSCICFASHFMYAQVHLLVGRILFHTIANFDNILKHFPFKCYLFVMKF